MVAVVVMEMVVVVVMEMVVVLVACCTSTRDMTDIRVL